MQRHQRFDQPSGQPIEGGFWSMAATPPRRGSAARDRATPGGGLPLGVHALAVLAGIERFNSTLVRKHAVTDAACRPELGAISRVSRQDRLCRGGFTSLVGVVLVVVSPLLVYIGRGFSIGYL